MLKSTKLTVVTSSNCPQCQSVVSAEDSFCQDCGYALARRQIQPVDVSVITPELPSVEQANIIQAIKNQLAITDQFGKKELLWAIGILILAVVIIGFSYDKLVKKPALPAVNIVPAKNIVPAVVKNKKHESKNLAHRSNLSQPATEMRPVAEAIKTESKGSDKAKAAAKIDADIVHYNQLLTNYFLKNGNDQNDGTNNQPPSFREWIEQGKFDF